MQLRYQYRVYPTPGQQNTLMRQRSRPAHEHFRIPLPVFDAAETSLVADAAKLDLPLPGANPHAAAHAVAQCRQLLIPAEPAPGWPAVSVTN